MLTTCTRYLRVFLPTKVRECLSQWQEGDGDEQWQGPIDSAGYRVAIATRPKRVNFWVDGPRHGAHACYVTHYKLTNQVPITYRSTTMQVIASYPGILARKMPVNSYLQNLRVTHSDWPWLCEGDQSECIERVAIHRHISSEYTWVKKRLWKSLLC